MNTNRWDERYGGKEYFFGTEPNGFLATTAPEVPRGKALCIADGEGRNSVYLAELGFTVTAMDASRGGMEKARRLASERGVTIDTVVADLADFAFGTGAWKLVVSVFCHLPKQLRADVHRRVVEALEPGGVFVLEAYTPDQLAYGTGGPPVAELLAHRDELEAELSGLEFAVSRETERDVIEGRGHWGKAAVVQILGKKHK